MTLEPDWVLFGGTFDPPHQGHMDAVKIACERFLEAEIVVVPSLAPPVSKGKQKSVVASFPDRVAMCVVAFDEWNRVQVSALEEDLPDPSYTINTLRDFRSEHSSQRLAWMIGADQLAAFLSWLEPKEILTIASLVVLPRPAQVAEALVDQTMKMARDLGFKTSVVNDGGIVLLEGACPIYILSAAPCEVSSSNLRSCLAANGEVNMGHIDPHVLAFIKDSNLYRAEKEG